MNVMEFTDWTPFQNFCKAPETTGVFQLRIDEGLLDYPTGKSTMFYFGYADNLNRNLDEFNKNILPYLDRTPDKLLLRWLPDPNAKARFEKRMNAFVNKFSCMPFGNEQWLKQLGQK